MTDSNVGQTANDTGPIAGNTGVIAASDIPASTSAGPYPGEFKFGVTTKDDLKVQYILEVKFQSGRLTLEIESSNQWLRCVQPARDRHEQNVEFYRARDGQIFLRTIQEIKMGEHLFAWYSDNLAREVGIPFLSLKNIQGNQQYLCDSCGEMFRYPNSLKSHMHFGSCSHGGHILNYSEHGSTKLFRPFLEGECKKQTISPSSMLPLKSTNSSTLSGIAKSEHDISVLHYRHDKSSRRSAFRPPVTAESLPVNLSLKQYSHEARCRSVNEANISHPIQIFNHIQPQVFPIPMTPMSSSLGCGRACCSVWSPYICNQGRFRETTLSGWKNNAKIDISSHEHRVYAGGMSKEVPLAIPLPTELDGEPLDLLPKSFFANKSKKGHLCIYCGKLYSRKYGLKIHLRTHTGYKPLKCKVCLRPFGDPSNLNKHVRLHAEGDTPYRCDYCGKVLVRRRDLERHIKSRHQHKRDTTQESCEVECTGNDDTEQEITVV